MSDIQPLAEGEYLFTSESVTEGHPDKVADAISDAVLDAVMAGDPEGRVACETLVNTGMAVVSGEISTSVHLDVPELVRETIREIGYDHGDYGYHCDHISVLVSLDKQSPDIAQGVDKAYETRTESAEDKLLIAGAGDQGMMFGYATDETEALMPMPIHLAHRLAERLAAVRKDGTLEYLGPDGKTQVTVRYADGRPVRVEKLLISTQHAEGVESESKIKPDLWESVVLPVLERRGPRPLRRDRAAPALPRQPDRQVRDRRPGRRRRPHRPQDHRRHLRRHGPPRRRRLLRQGPVQGRPLGRLRGPPRRQERRRRRPRPALRGPGRLRDRRRPPDLADGRDLRHRQAPRLADLPPGRSASSTSAQAPSAATSTCTARSSARPPPTATSAAKATPSPGSARIGPRR